MPNEFRKVPAVEKCFAILQHLAKSRQPLGISEISKQLGLNKSTVYNISYTLKNLQVLDQNTNGKFHFGTLLYLLGNASGNKSELLQTVRPYLEKINRRTKLSAFLGIRTGRRAVIIDKVDTADNLKFSAEVGMRLPLMAGAGGKALLSQLSDREIDRLLGAKALKKYTPRTCTDKKVFKKDVLMIRKEGVAFDNEEYIDGVIALAVPLATNRPDLQAAVWVVGLKQQVSRDKQTRISKFLKIIAKDISYRLLV